MRVSPLAGKPAPASILVNVPKLVSAYYTEKPDPNQPEQLVSFGTSGHRGSSFNLSFNENHILAITQAICLYRAQNLIDGPLFMGLDTHALSVPAAATALEVLAANNVFVFLSKDDEYTPTPAVSLAILNYNEGRINGLADGIVITPSHNPPKEGGFKYNPPHGGPADQTTTSWIESKANEFLKNNLNGIKRIDYQKALKSSNTRRYNFMRAYVEELKNVINMDLLSASGIKMGVDPLGGAGVHYWRNIADRYKLNLTVVSEVVDPTFSFMTVDWDGQIRMDPSSPYAMQRLIGLKDEFQIAFASDTDHDRHGIVTKSSGLMFAVEYLSVAVSYLFRHRPNWDQEAVVGKTLVSSSMIDRVTKRLGRKLYEVPVGFKWFVEGLYERWMGFGGEESAGASFLRLNGSVWTTDKDGMIPALLAGEMTAQLGKDPGEIYQDLTREFGKPFFDRVDAKATKEQKERLKKITPQQLTIQELAGEKIEKILTKAPGNGASIGGIKVVSANGWFAARPSGTEDIYKIYAESFVDESHLKRILSEAQQVVDRVIADPVKV